jgi:5'-nucleotidase/UDP-sugar diphosphatase
MMKRMLIIALAISMVMVALPTTALAADSKDVSILFTSDMHSHMQSSDGLGGLARIKTAVDSVKKQYPNSFLFDGGDFTMGTPYETVFMTEAAELRLMGELGYDAGTFGNHEFDYKPAGLAAMLNSARTKSGTAHLPYLVNSNINWKKTLADKKLAGEASKLKKAMDAYGVSDYRIINKGGVRIAVFGLMGKEAIADSPMSGLKWTDYIESAKSTVAAIRKSGQADMIVCLSHSGMYASQGDKAEDKELAKAVPDIDLIISGHSHESVSKPVKEGDTYIVSCGCFTEKLGHVILKKSGDRYKLVSYKLTEMNSSVAQNSAMKAKVDSYLKYIDSEYFSRFGYSGAQKLASSDFDFPSDASLDAHRGESTLGNLITDSYVYAVKKIEGSDYRNIDVAVVPSGVVRGYFKKGDVTVADAFDVASLGIGPDNIPGYPLVSIYATGKEVKLLAEVDMSVSPYIAGTKLYFSGLKYKYNLHRLIMNRTYDVTVNNGEKIDNNKLYRVVVDLYSCQMIGSMKSASKGLLSFVPKDKNGKAIKDINTAIITGKDGELKQWYAIASYIDSFKGNKIPAYYAENQGRKVDQTGWNPVSLLKQPNVVSLGAAAIVLLLALVVFLIVRRIRRHRERKRAK